MATDRCDEDELDGWHASDLEIDVDAGTKGKPRTERGASSGSALLAGVDTKKSSKQLPAEIDESLAPRTGAAGANTMKQKLAALRGKMVENGGGSISAGSLAGAMKTSVCEQMRQKAKSYQAEKRVASPSSVGVTSAPQPQ